MVWVSILVAHPGLGQTDIQSLERLLKGQQKALLNFSGDPIARYTWQDGTLQSEKPGVHTLAIFFTDSISEKGNVLEFAGKRATLVFDSKQQSFGLSVREPMRLEVNLTGTTTADVIPKIIGLLFFQSLKDAVAGVPKQLANRIPYDVSSRKGPKQLGQLVYQGESWERLEYGDPRYRPPSLISAKDPAFTDEARQKHYSGTETIFLKLSEAGEGSDYWMAWPLDYGLNPQAIAAVKNYVFKPATLDGKPTATIIGIEVTFRFR
jgi:hypothetical protein